MGNKTFENGIRSTIKQEFENLRLTKQRDYLTVSEIIKFQHPEYYPFTFNHLGNLFVLNSSRSGVFTLQELYQFAEFCQKNLKTIKTYEFQSQLQAATTQVLLSHLQRQGGEDEIVDWVEQILLRNEKNPLTFEKLGNTKFIRIQTVKIIYEVFNVKMMNGMEIQSFFYLLQQCGEEAGLMAPDAKELDEYAPAEMGKEFARQYLKGFAKLMREVGFNDDLQLANESDFKSHQQQKSYLNPPGRHEENISHFSSDDNILQHQQSHQNDIYGDDQDSDEDYLHQSDMQQLQQQQQQQYHPNQEEIFEKERKYVQGSQHSASLFEPESAAYNEQHYYLSQSKQINKSQTQAPAQGLTGMALKQPQSQLPIVQRQPPTHQHTTSTDSKASGFMIPPLQINLISKGGMANNNNYN